MDEDVRSKLDDNRSFWERRGEQARASDPALTLLSGHLAYTSYVHDREFAFLRGFVNVEDRVLDIGCGVGRVSLALAPYVREVTGIDFASSLVRRAQDAANTQGLSNTRFELAEASSGALPTGPFDVIVISGVLYCMDDEQALAVLTRARAAMAPFGRLYMRNACANIARHERRKSADLAPVVYRSPEEYVRMSEQAGFVVEQERFLFAPFCWPNHVYYHLLPRGVRDTGPVQRVLRRWFELEGLTSEWRLRALGRAYPKLLRAAHKATSFRVLVAR